MSLDGLREKLKGIFPAIPTPLTSAGTLDEDGLRRLVAYLVEGGIHGLWVLGSGGTYVVHTNKEKQEIIRPVMQEVAGRIPVLAGAGDCGTRKALETIDLVANAGANAAFVVSPFYFSHDQAELVEYFEDIAADSAIPFMIYNNPVNTQNGLTPESLAFLARNQNILGVKDSTCDFSYFQKLVAKLKGSPAFRIFQGAEPLVAPSFLFGAHGAVFGLANVAPRLCVEVYEAAEAKDVSRLVQLQERFMSLLEIEDIHGEPNDRCFLGGILAALEALGICGRTLPRPFSTFTDQEASKVDSLLKQAGVDRLERTRA